ncbi:MAG: tyrosine-type recombinase/integrase [Planctomycetes bacterium]|nr:tyrosine-type recombinase/integrase [Planctomycetota bacterium]
MPNTIAQYKKDLEIKGFSERTNDSYLRHVRSYRDHLDRPIDSTAAGEQVKDYFHYLLQTKKVSRSYVHQSYSALKYYYTVTLGLEWDMEKIPRVRHVSKLPEILNSEEIKRLLDVTKNIKHKTMLMVTYSAGLRVSETAALKVADIDSERMTIRVDQGKGNKDRYTLLAESALEYLRGYWRMYEPTHWLFEGQDPTRHLTASSLQRAFYASKEKACIKKHVTVHSLRHSFATHLLEQGTDIHIVQRLLGHGSIKTTTVYLHLKKESLTKVVSPLDHLLDDNET